MNRDERYQQWRKEADAPPTHSIGELSLTKFEKRVYPDARTPSGVEVTVASDAPVDVAADPVVVWQQAAGSAAHQFPRPGEESPTGLPDVDPAAVELAMLGELNRLTRSTDGAPDQSDLAAWTRAWVAEVAHVSVDHVENVPARQLADALATAGREDAASELREAVARAQHRVTDHDGHIGPLVAYEFTRFNAPDYDSGTRASAHDREDSGEDPTPMSDFELSNHVETETATRYATDETSVPATVDADGEVVEERTEHVTVERETEVVAGGCQRDGCTEDHLPVEAAVPVFAGVTEDGRGRTVEAWCPFCAKSIYGDDVVDGELDVALPAGDDTDTDGDPLSARERVVALVEQLLLVVWVGTMAGLLVAPGVPRWFALVVMVVGLVAMAEW